MRRKLFACLAAAVVLSCQSEVPPDTELVDDAGRAVVMDGAAQRIVSLSPSITELLFEIGAGHLVVGRTRWGEDPPEALAVPSVGDGLNPNVETVVARRPDLVLFYLSPSNDPAIARLTDLGIATGSFRLDRLEDLTRVAGMLGSLTGAGDRARSALDAFEARLQETSVSDPEPVSVLLLAWDNPPIVIGGASFLSEIVDRAGGKNVFADIDRPSLTVSIETIAAREADVLLVTGGETASFVDRAEWQVVRTIRDRHFAVVDGSEFSQPSFRAPEAIAELRRVLDEYRR